VEDTFLRLACLTYSDDGVPHWNRAAGMLAADPSLASRSPHTAAACGTAWPTDPQEPGGPYGWPPLMYLAYSRLERLGNPVGAATAMLDASADPTFSVLWRGQPTPFTVLTGVLGGGEQGQPPHPLWRELAALLLRRGADPNDAQALYNRMFGDDAHFGLLLAHGLNDRGLLADQLRWAVGHDLAERTRMLLGFADPDLLAELSRDAARLGHARTAAVLAAVGAPEAELGPVDALVGGILGGDLWAEFRGEQAPENDRADRAALLDLPWDDPELLAEARQTHGWVLVWAAGQGDLALVERLLGLGFDANARGRGDLAEPSEWETALHQAAHRGDNPMIIALLGARADDTLRDQRFDGTPADWAEHGGHHEIARRLRELPPLDEDEDD
jgi:hypothetical protein